MDLRRKTLLLLGPKRTGPSVARFAAGRGARGRVVDCRSAEDLAPGVAKLGGARVDLRSATPASLALEGVDAVIPSSAVPRTAAVLHVAGKGGVPVWSEVTFAYRQLSSPHIAVTGANGKSTTANQVGAILGAGGASVFVWGNLGTPYERRGRL